MQQCHFLEQHIGTNYLQLCLKDPSNARSIVREAKKDILSKDWFSTLRDSKTHSSLAVVSATDEVASSWYRVWDEALEYGVRGTRLMQGLFSALSRPTFGNKSCPLCKDTIPTSYPEHLFTKHLANYNVDTIVGWLENKTTKTCLNLLKPSHRVFEILTPTHQCKILSLFLPVVTYILLYIFVYFCVIRGYSILGICVLYCVLHCIVMYCIVL